MRVHERYTHVTGLVGYMGSGKTAGLVELVLASLRAGRPCYTNAGFVVVDHEKSCTANGQTDCECPSRSQEFFSLEEVVAIPSGSTVALDEAQNFVWSRNTSKFPRGVMYRLRHGRKDDLRFYWSAVDEMDVDVSLRRATAFVVENSRFGRWPLFHQKWFPPIDKRRADDKPIRSRWYLMKKDVLNAYDTWAHVWISPEVIEQLREDAEKGWVPLTPALSDAIMDRDSHAIDTALKEARDVGREYQERSRGARGRGVSAADVAPQGLQYLSTGQCDSCLEFRGLAYTGHDWLCQECMAAAPVAVVR
jgi:hypothetical protein